MTPPRNLPDISALAQLRLALPNRPSQGEIANRISDQIGEVIGQQAISYWEKGKVDLRNVHPRRLRAYAKVLRISEAELAEVAGYAFSELFPDSVPTSSPARPARPLPDGLQDAVREYGARFPDLTTTRWQQYLARLAFRRGPPETAEAWLNVYRDLIRSDIEPEDGN